MIRILTDSTADFSAQDIAELGILTVPLNVHMNDAQYLDGIDLTADRFYEMLETTDKLPTTSQPTPERFMAHFAAAQEAGDTLICILISTTLSGTFQSAQIAKEEVGYENIYLVDSTNVTLAANLLVRRALQRIAEGMTAEEILADLQEAVASVRLYAVVDTLKYLHKGGRLSAAVALAGGLLGIKPVISVLDGKLGMADKARGLPGAFVAIFKRIEKDGGIDEAWPVMVGYTGKRHTAEPFMRYVTERLHLQTPFLSSIGPVVGTHAGPGACGIAYFAKNN